MPDSEIIPLLTSQIRRVVWLGDGWLNDACPALDALNQAGAERPDIYVNTGEPGWIAIGTHWPGPTKLQISFDGVNWSDESRCARGPNNQWEFRFTDSGVTRYFRIVTCVLDAEVNQQ